tara:strand:- start:1731 stop:2849 length:1119 start_codon:yes stop_codon:yes gene_type:complete
MQASNIIIIIILILLLVWILSKFFFTTDIIYDIMCDASLPAGETDSNSQIASYLTTDKNIILNKDFKENNTSNFMLSVWFYIDNWGNNLSNFKNILYMAKQQNAKTPASLENSLIGMSKKIDSGEAEVTGTGTNTNTIPYKNLSICLDKYENNLFIDIETTGPALDEMGRCTIGTGTGVVPWPTQSIQGFRRNNPHGTDVPQNKCGICQTSNSFTNALANACTGPGVDWKDYTWTSGSGATYTYTRYKVKNIPIQKWNNITISIDSKTLDVYLDGKLRNSFILHGIYRSKLSGNDKKNIYVGDLGTTSGVSNPGFEGLITRIRYQPNPINPEEAYNIYRDGIDSSVAKSLYNKYGLKVSFMEYDRERGSFTF